MSEDVKKMLEALFEAILNHEHDFDCDGSSRIISYVLQSLGISHVGHVGMVIYTSTTTDRSSIINPHYWIALSDSDEVIDIKLRKWVNGDDVPNGVFELKDHPNCTYHVGTTHYKGFPYGNVLYEQVLGPVPAVEECFQNGVC